MSFLQIAKDYSSALYKYHMMQYKSTEKYPVNAEVEGISNGGITYDNFTTILMPGYCHHHTRSILRV